MSGGDRPEGRGAAGGSDGTGPAGPTDDARDTLLATLCAAFLIAWQVAGKATRDALFLSAWSVQELPAMIGGAAVVSLLVVLLVARELRRQGPLRLVPRVFLGSALVLVMIAAVGDRAPRLVAVLVYLHFAAFGAVLVSGFWSALNERFDPRAARRRFGRIALGGTFGGLVGGLLAERLAALLSVEALLPVLAALHLVCALLLWRVRAVAGAAEPPAPLREALAALPRVPYLRNLALLVFTATLAAVCLDYVFKVRATESVAAGAELLRFFALFYTGLSVLTFLLQAGLAERLLERAGLARTVATLPAGVALASAGALVLPGLPTAAVARGVEGSLRNSLFRSGYEPLYVPVPVDQKRAAKQLIDVGCERLGDVAGAAVIAAVVFAVPLRALAVLSGVALVLGLVGVWITRRLHAGWVGALEGRLEDRAAELDLDAYHGSTRTVIFRTLEALDLRKVARRSGGEVPVEASGSDAGSGGRSAAASPEADDLLALASRDAERIRRLLVRTPQIRREWVPLVIGLLARDDLHDVAAAALRGAAARDTGQLLDRLLDADEDFAVRRRLPPILAEVPTQRVVDGLFAGLADRRFEVRYQCARALLHLRQREQDLRFEPERVLDAVQHEVSVGRHVWEGHRLLDRRDAWSDSPFDEELLRRRSALGLEHVFTLLALVLPAHPLSIAYRGLFTDDRALRGTALEYLESVLPARVREGLWPYLDTEAYVRPAAEDEQAVLDRLLRSHASIQLNLEEQGD